VALSTVLSVVLTVVCILPGLVFAAEYSLWTAGRKESAFVEASRITIAGTLAAAAALIVLAWMTHLGLPLLAFDKALVGGRAYLADRLDVLVLTAAAFLVLGCTAAATGARLFPRELRARRRHRSAWVVTFEDLRDQVVTASAGNQLIAEVRARLDTGDIIEGEAVAWSVASSKPDERELVLAQPRAQVAEGNLDAWKTAGGTPMYSILPGSAIKQLDVNFVPAKPPRARPARSGPNRMTRIWQEHRWAPAWLLLAQSVLLWIAVLAVR
jgi:hypothetical protein